MDFTKLFEREIPLNVAADFYLGMTKKAEWDEPPDMTGQLEGMFTVPKETVVAKLSTIISMKLRLMVGYYTYAQSLNDTSLRGMKRAFDDHALDEKCGADFYMRRAAVLGGPVSFDPIEPPPPTTNVATVMTTLLRAEQEMIAAQRELRQLVGDENPMRVGIEDQLVRDQFHSDELIQMMPAELRLALEQGGVQEMGMEPPAEMPAEAPAEAPPAEAVPEEAKTAAWLTELRFDKAAGVGQSLHRAGVAVQKGARRAGELLTGSRAESLANKAEEQRGKVQHAARVADHMQSMRGPSGWNGTDAAKRYIEPRVPELSRAVKHSKKYNDMAVGELDRSNKVQSAVKATALAVPAGLIAARMSQRSEASRKKEAAERFEKAATTWLEGSGAGSLAGMLSGYTMGKNTAGQTAAALAPEGRVLRSEEIARQAATVGAPAGGLAGLYVGASNPSLRAGAAGLAQKVGLPPIAAEIMVPMALAALGSMAGGALTGAATAGVQQLRGPVGKKSKDGSKTAATSKVLMSGGVNQDDPDERYIISALQRRGLLEQVHGTSGPEVLRGADAVRDHIRSERGRDMLGGGLLGGALGAMGGGLVGAATGAGTGHGGRGALIGGALGALGMGAVGARTAAGVNDRQAIKAHQGYRAIGDTIAATPTADHKLRGSTLEMMRQKAAPAEKVAGLLFDLAIVKLANPDIGTAEPSMVAPSAQQMEPTNYLNAERAGRQAQEQNESAYYRQQLQQTSQQSQVMQQQLADMQAQMQQSQMQPDQTQQFMQQAVMAQDEATRQAMEAAKARIGAQQLRSMVLEAVSQDPMQLGEQAFPQQQVLDPMTGQPAQVDPATGQPMAADPMSAQAGAADPAQAQASPAPPGQGAEAVPQQKMASYANAAVGALGGAALGAGSSLMAGRRVAGLRSQVESLEGQGKGGFFQAARLAATKAGLATAELAASHPVGSALSGAASGALVGASQAPVIGNIRSSLSELVR